MELCAPGPFPGTRLRSPVDWSFQSSTGECRAIPCTPEQAPSYAEPRAVARDSSSRRKRLADPAGRSADWNWAALLVPVPANGPRLLVSSTCGFAAPTVPDWKIELNCAGTFWMTLNVTLPKNSARRKYRNHRGCWFCRRRRGHRQIQHGVRSCDTADSTIRRRASRAIGRSANREDLAVADLLEKVAAGAEHKIESSFGSLLCCTP